MHLKTVKNYLRSAQIYTYLGLIYLILLILFPEKIPGEFREEASALILLLLIIEVYLARANKMLKKTMHSKDSLTDGQPDNRGV
ncbi:hypothetical protein Dalk_1958 [Desulfatibacillum aliphaticivorans]|uniref:Uncharacterized protein n=1 Tax=Desulfatibacillum aliphaticivorans TaxID=218208 RepID=B8FEX7_DESAL|nr:hypothetical protein [Desulfatibacillum aliphaticivorans]ACL03654.1 hypothetical protein Dalk_1958 [Desulfatibacillum aliphaticivorans]